MRLRLPALPPLPSASSYICSLLHPVPGFLGDEELGSVYCLADVDAPAVPFLEGLISNSCAEAPSARRPSPSGTGTLASSSDITRNTNYDESIQYVYMVNTASNALSVVEFGKMRQGCVGLHARAPRDKVIVCTICICYVTNDSFVGRRALIAGACCFSECLGPCRLAINPDQQEHETSCSLNLTAPTLQMDKSICTRVLGADGLAPLACLHPRYLVCVYQPAASGLLALSVFQT